MQVSIRDSMSAVLCGSIALMPAGFGASYHRQGGEGLDLLDGAGSPLLEGDTVKLFNPSASRPSF